MLVVCFQFILPALKFTILLSKLRNQRLNACRQSIHLKTAAARRWRGEVARLGHRFSPGGQISHRPQHRLTQNPRDPNACDQSNCKHNAKNGECARERRVERTLVRTDHQCAKNAGWITDLIVTQCQLNGTGCERCGVAATDRRQQRRKLCLTGRHNFS